MHLIKLNALNMDIPDGWILEQLIKVNSCFIFYKNNLLWTSARKEGRRVFFLMAKRIDYVYSL